MAEPAIKQPNDTFIFKMNDGTEAEIFMSYGLLNDLTKITPNMESGAELYTDSDKRNEFLSMMLSQRSPSGRVTLKMDALDIPAPYKNFEDLLGWGVEHVTNFFLRNLSNFTARLQNLTADLPSDLPISLTNTQNGSES